MKVVKKIIGIAFIVFGVVSMLGIPSAIQKSLANPDPSQRTAQIVGAVFFTAMFFLCGLVLIRESRQTKVEPHDEP